MEEVFRDHRYEPYLYQPHSPEAMLGGAARHRRRTVRPSRRRRAPQTIIVRTHVRRRAPPRRPRARRAPARRRPADRTAADRLDAATLRLQNALQTTAPTFPSMPMMYNPWAGVQFPSVATSAATNSHAAGNTLNAAMQHPINITTCCPPNPPTPEYRPVRQHPRPPDGELHLPVPIVAPTGGFTSVVAGLRALARGTRRVILTALLGYAGGLVIDALVGTVGIPPGILQGILSLVPGGATIVGALEALFALTRRHQSPLESMPADPGFAALAEKVRGQLPEVTPEAIMEAANQQLGTDNPVRRTIAAVLSFFASRAKALSLVPVVGIVRPFTRR